MFQNIIVGWDGSPHAQDGLALAVSLARATGGSLTLACAAQEVPSYFHLDTLEARLQAEAEDALAKVRLPAGAIGQRTAITARSPAQALYELAEKQHSDLIVLGSSHRSAVGRVLAGSVGYQVLAGSPCAVAVAPAGLREREAGPLNMIGVGYDGESESRYALQAAGELAALAGATILVLSVIAPTPAVVAPSGAAAYPVLQTAASDHARRIVDEALASLSADVTGSFEILSGRTATSLSEAAQRHQLDLLVVGSRAFGPVRRVLLGSVAAGLMTASPAPLLVVPRADDNAPGSGIGKTESATSSP